LVAAVIAGAALAFLLGRDGSPGWQLVRVLGVAAWTVWVHRTVTGRSDRGWTVLVMGLFALVAGAGIGVPHVVKVGITMTSIAGMCALVAGLCLVVWSVARMVARLGRWPRRAALVASVVVVGLIAWTFVPAVMVTNVPPIPLGSRTPADVGLTYVDVELTTDDGVRLAAWYVPSMNGAAVVIRHGAGSTRSNVLDHAAAARRQSDRSRPTTGSGLSARRVRRLEPAPTSRGCRRSSVCAAGSRSSWSGFNTPLSTSSPRPRHHVRWRRPSWMRSLDRC
jgi:hypothetical protein